MDGEATISGYVRLFDSFSSFYSKQTSRLRVV